MCKFVLCWSFVCDVLLCGSFVCVFVFCRVYVCVLLVVLCVCSCSVDPLCAEVLFFGSFACGFVLCFSFVYVSSCCTRVDIFFILISASWFYKNDQDFFLLVCIFALYLIKQAVFFSALFHCSFC